MQLPLKDYTIYILSGSFKEAERMAEFNLNSQQAYTWIEGAFMLDNLNWIHIIRMDSYWQHPDIDAITETLNQMQVEYIGLE